MKPISAKRNFNPALLTSDVRPLASVPRPSTLPFIHNSTPGNSQPAALSSESWEVLLHHTILYAAGHVRRWYWRGSLGGVPPDGFDPNSLASEAIAEFLQDSGQQPELIQLPIIEIQRDLERRVRRHINRLHHRSENRLIRNEPDLAPLALGDGEFASIIETFP